MQLTYLIKELARRRTRSITNVLAVAVLVAILVVLTSVMNAYTAAIYLPFQNIGADLVVQKSSNQATDTPTSSIRLPYGKGIFPQNEMDSIVAIPHVEGVSKSLTLWQFDKGKFISIEGVEPASFVGNKLNSGITAGRFLQTNDGNKVVVEKHFAKFYGLKLGDSLKLGNTSFDIVGIVAAQGESQVSSTNIYMNLGDAQRLLGTEGYSQLYVRLDAMPSEDAVRSAINNVDSGAIVVSGSSIATSLNNAVKIYDKFHIVGSVILALIVAFILFQVNTAGLLERRKEIGVMQTVGWTRRSISQQIISEITIQAILGCILAVVISLIAVGPLGSIGIQANQPGDLSNNLSNLTIPVTVSAQAIVEFCALALAISTVVSLLLAKRMSGMKPLVNLRNL